MELALRDRYLGALLGLACGDAVGAPIEFLPRGRRRVAGMEARGTHDLPPGFWTDDTSMALCLAESLIVCRGFDARDQMDRYRAWLNEGHLSSVGYCFDIGNTVYEALRTYETTGNPYAGPTRPNSAGNGSIMRLAPVVLAYHPDRAAVLHYAALSSRVTHQAPEAVEGCVLLASILDNALAGRDKEAVLTDHGADVVLGSARLREVAAGAYLNKGEDEIRGSGYVVESLEAALWSFATTDSLEAAVLRVANLGDDADTTAAVCGQVAGAYYGVQAIPDAWIRQLHDVARICHFACMLYDLREDLAARASHIAP